MQKYTEYKQLDLAKIAESIQTFWQANHIFQQSIQLREGKPTFTLYEGPPSANGTPGIHHLLAITIKDLFCRYKTTQGYQVKRKAGWDTHGLPVELQVEKKLGITKEDIGQKISIEAYNAQCRKTVMQYKKQWEALHQKIGYWLDTTHPYITFDRNYIESLWHLLKQLHEKKLLYKGKSIQPYSPAAGTGLSSHELNQPGCYKTIQDTTIVAQFKVKETPQDYFLAWTTTPWTLPANSALAVGENINYVKVRTFNPYTYQLIQVILAEAAIPRYFTNQANSKALQNYQPGAKEIPWEIIAHYTGKELIGLAYEQLLPYVQPAAPAFRVIAGDFVTTAEGTGIVHIAPTFGIDDQIIAQKEYIPAITVKDAQGEEMPIVDKQGRFIAAITDFAGRYVKAAYEPVSTPKPNHQSVDELLATKLKRENKAFKVATYAHSYPHCWRTDKPILYYPLDAWFIKTTACKQRLIEQNKKIHWQPSTIGKGRFGKWLANLGDWNLSRDRYWGTPLPIWRTADQQEEKCIGSLQELKSEVDKAVAAGFMAQPLSQAFDPHRPYVDQLILVSKQGKKMYREAALVDVWFDSGAMPYAQWHYPFENNAAFKAHYPADLVAEGIDQTRGWFFTLHALAVMLFDAPAFRHGIVNGLILDKNGNKMSKRLDNALDPMEIMAQYGPDTVRWYLISNANPWDNLKFDPKGLTEVTRKFFATLQNTYNFFALYANLDQFCFTTPRIPLAQGPLIDRWMHSRRHSLIQTVAAAYEAYEPTSAARAIQNFVVEDLSNWYVRLNRKRFWKNAQDQDKQAAYQTLYTCLLTVAQLAAPIAPFYMEQLYQDLNRVTKKEVSCSVHLLDFPQTDPQAIDTPLETQMQQAQLLVSLVHSLRKKHKIKVRQPLAKILIPIEGDYMKNQIAKLEDLILTEINVKQIVYINNTDAIVTKKIKPNFRQLGKRYGAHMPAISQAIAQLNQTEIKTLEQTQQLPLLLKEAAGSLTLADVLITSEAIPGSSIASEGGLTVALDITLNEALKQEGLARELVNRIQQLRKDSGLAVQDKISLTIAPGQPFVAQAVTQYQTYLSQEVQALQLAIVRTVPNGIHLAIDGYTATVKIKKIHLEP